MHVDGMRPKKERTFKSIYPYGYGKMLVLTVEYGVERFVLNSQAKFVLISSLFLV